jgi:hypothetical protein
MTKSSIWNLDYFICFEIGYWNLFGAWNLVIGI